MPFTASRPVASAAASGSLQQDGATPAVHNALAVDPAQRVDPAGGDVVSALVAMHFNNHVNTYHTAAAQTAVVLDMLARIFNTNAASRLRNGGIDASVAE
ncbi:PE family protein [Mycobacterium sp. E2497]|uniref:PE family protein n=1 Tax=Mycobacterium sp. E2497 TaxID=1834135 RepID=UPI0007FD8B19|nr:PE family protein [Mycobacterium sp. E2497]OBI14110.1 hypothetical protein A5713_25820 [Mycobacterium sp. E2497]